MAGEVKADLPIKELGDEAPLYDRPMGRRHPPSRCSRPRAWRRRVSNAQALLTLVGSPDLASKRWVWEQYDHLILGEHGAASRAATPPSCGSATGPRGWR